MSANGGASAVEDVDYVEQRGPGIPDLPQLDPRELAPPVGGEVLEPQFPGWSQDAIEAFLKGIGHGVHMMIGQGEQDWLMTKQDLERMGPPLTRIANRWEPALRLSPYADPLLVAHGAALWAWRSVLERQRAIRDSRADELNRGPGWEQPGEEDLELEDEELGEDDYETEPAAPAPRAAGGTLFPDAPIHQRRRRHQ